MRKAAEAVVDDWRESAAAKHIARMLIQALDDEERNARALERVLHEAKLLFAEIARRGQLAADAPHGRRTPGAGGTNG
ncbi:MAG: hypothetical protein RIQ93_2678 [Verrucomicrobiota bacterium]